MKRGKIPKIKRMIRRDLEGESLLRKNIIVPKGLYRDCIDVINKFNNNKESDIDYYSFSHYIGCSLLLFNDIMKKNKLREARRLIRK